MEIFLLHSCFYTSDFESSLSFDGEIVYAWAWSESLAKKFNNDNTNDKLPDLG